MRLTRSAMLDVLGTEYIKLARMKGLPERQVIWKHALKNAALPVVTFAALLFVSLLNGSIIVETVFGWPGLGLLIIEAVQYRDYPVVQTVVLCLSGMYNVANLLVVVLFGYLHSSTWEGAFPLRKSCWAFVTPGRRALRPPRAPPRGGGAPGRLYPQSAPQAPEFPPRGAAGKRPEPAAWHGRVNQRARARHRPPGTRHPEWAHLWGPDLPGCFAGGHS